MKNAAAAVTLGILILAGTALPASGGKVDLLIEKLVEKKILTQSEAQELLSDVEKEAEEKSAEKKSAALPKWVGKMKLKGDIRLRYEHNETDDNADRERGRFRWRLGAETNAGDNVKIGFGLASGGDDPRSTNQSFDDSFSSKGIVIDYAYAQYTPLKWLTLSGGKIKNPLYRPGDLLWDSDIRPEGAAAGLNWNIAEDLGLFLTPGIFILEEDKGSTDDPFMYALQAGLKWKPADDIHMKFAATGYGFSNVEGNLLEHTKSSNTLEGGGLKYDYDSIGLGIEFGYANLGFLPYAGVFGEYIYNPDPDDKNQGYLAGIVVGHKEVKGFGKWQAKYNYRRLERDAWPDIFPDSDFFGGASNSKGHEGIFIFGLSDRVSLGVDYYNTEEIKSVKEISQELIQFDLNLKY